jgi:hypothetical protein
MTTPAPYPDWCQPRADHQGAPVHHRELDTWSAEAQPGVTVAIDASGCIVVHTRTETFTVTDAERFASYLLMAKQHRDMNEEAAQRQADPNWFSRDAAG